MRHAAVAVAVLLVAGASGCSKKKEKPNYGDRIVTAYDRGKVSGARGDLQTLSLAITQFYTAKGNLPEAESIDALAAQIAPSYVRRAPTRDPWGTPYDYQTDGNGYWLTSAGHDLEFDTEDDVEVTDGQITRLPKGYERLQ